MTLFCGFTVIFIWNLVPELWRPATPQLNDMNQRKKKVTWNEKSYQTMTLAKYKFTKRGIVHKNYTAIDFLAFFSFPFVQWLIHFSTRKHIMIRLNWTSGDMKKLSGICLEQKNKDAFCKYIVWWQYIFHFFMTIQQTFKQLTLRAPL